MLKRSILIVFLVLLIDQLVKFYIKTHFTLGQEQFLLGSYFRLYFIENNGMAFGFEFGGKAGKVFLSLIRIAAVFVIGYLILKAIRKNESPLLIVCLSLIFAGAFGNIIDSAFYGLIFSESDFLNPAVLFPSGGGYAGFLQGRVVDMFYAPVIDTNLPSWVPVFGGRHFQFFRPIFNVADSSISIGVVMMLIFYNRIFRKNPSVQVTQTEPEISEATEK